MVPPYRFCLGSDNGTDACLIQGEANTAKLLNGTRAFRFFSKTVSQLPAATEANTGQVYWITDGKSASNCTLGRRKFPPAVYFYGLDLAGHERRDAGRLESANSNQ